MSDWKPKRFWSSADVIEAGTGFTVHLDSRPVRTPAKAALVVPTRALAGEIAREWDAQDGQVNPLTMPFTRSANAAIDKVALQRDEVAELLAAYGDTDLLCYRADSPAELVARQTGAWDPLLDWADEALGARLIPVAGVMHQPQSKRALAALAAQVHALDDFALTAFHDLVGMSGSLILGFAALHDLRPAAELWALSRVDETYQAELWGVDEEAAEIAARKESEFMHAKAFYDLSRPI